MAIPKAARKSIAAKVRMIMQEYESTGKVGKVKPKNKMHALKIALGMAYNMHREGTLAKHLSD